MFSMFFRPLKVASNHYMSLKFDIAPKKMAVWKTLISFEGTFTGAAVIHVW